MRGVQRIEITHRSTKPVEQLYDYLAEHENLGPLFGAKVRRVRDGDTSRNGAGSVRALRVGPLPEFHETVTAAVPCERIEYRITRGGILKDHRGVMTFRPDGPGSVLHYVIEFGAKLPGLDRVVKPVLVRSLRQGLAGL